VVAFSAVNVNLRMHSLCFTSGCRPFVLKKIVNPFDFVLRRRTILCSECAFSCCHLPRHEMQVPVTLCLLKHIAKLRAGHCADAVQTHPRQLLHNILLRARWRLRLLHCQCNNTGTLPFDCFELTLLLTLQLK
jgi:hypothetical protein